MATKTPFELELISNLDIFSCISFLFFTFFYLIFLLDPENKLKMTKLWFLFLTVIFMSLSCLFGSGTELLEHHLPLVKPWFLHMGAACAVLGLLYLHSISGRKGHKLESH